jgi:hypothetical protein
MAPGLVQHIEKLIIVVVLLSILPMVWHAYKERARARAAEKMLADATASREPVEVPAGREP